MSVDRPFTDRPIWVSISDNPDLKRLGYSSEHVTDTFLEFARYSLAAGANIVYGGDLRRGGFTRQLFELVESYPFTTGERRRPRVRNFLAWPIWEQLDPEEEKRLQAFVRFEKVERPPIGFERGPRTPDDQRVENTHCLTAMRERMVEYVKRGGGGQIMMGGKTSGFSGLYPGLLEEAALAMRNRIPMFVIGAFGGAAREIGRIIFRERKGEAFDRPSVERSQFEPPRTSVEELIEMLMHGGPEGLNNGLDEDANRTLLESNDLREVLRLTLQGLVNCVMR